MLVDIAPVFVSGLDLETPVLDLDLKTPVLVLKSSFWQANYDKSLDFMEDIPKGL